MGVKLKIWYYVNADEQGTYESLGVDVSTDQELREQELREQVFFVIESIVASNDGGSIIFSGGQTFVSPESMEEIQHKIYRSNLQLIKN